jgi:hypothetical protein
MVQVGEIIKGNRLIDVDDCLTTDISEQCNMFKELIKSLNVSNLYLLDSAYSPGVITSPNSSICLDKLDELEHESKAAGNNIKIKLAYKQIILGLKTNLGYFTIGIVDHSRNHITTDAGVTSFMRRVRECDSDKERMGTVQKYSNLYIALINCKYLQGGKIGKDGAWATLPSASVPALSYEVSRDWGGIIIRIAETSLEEEELYPFGVPRSKLAIPAHRVDLVQPESIVPIQPIAAVK